MLFVLWLIVRLLARLLVLSNADDGTNDLEILVLRHQLRVLRRKSGRRRFTAGDRVLLAAASRALPRRRWASLLVTPQTLLRWHRTLVRRKWTSAKQRTPGRSPVDPQTADLILRRDSGVRPVHGGDDRAQDAVGVVLHPAQHQAGRRGRGDGAA
jgi:putative transposase